MMAWRVGAAAAEAAPRSMAEARRGVSGVECSLEGEVDGVSPLMPTTVDSPAAFANAEGFDREGKRPSASPPDTTCRGAILLRRAKKKGRSLKDLERGESAREAEEFASRRSMGRSKINASLRARGYFFLFLSSKKKALSPSSSSPYPPPKEANDMLFRHVTELF